MKKAFSFASFALLVASLLLASGARADDLEIYSVDEPPSNYTLNDKFTGTSTDIVEAIEKSLGLDIPIQVIPVARALRIAEAKRNVLLYSYGRTPEREQQGFHFVGPVMTHRHFLWKRKADPTVVTNLDDVRKLGLPVACPRGDWRAQFLEADGISVVEESGHDNDLRMLLAGRVSLIVASDMQLPGIAKMIGADISAVEPVLGFAVGQSYLMFSKDTDGDILGKWQSAFVALQNSGFFAEGAEKWGQILGGDLKYSPDRGYYFAQPTFAK
jgi:polar amino acid transport system substrate-binding protein